MCLPCAIPHARAKSGCFHARRGGMQRLQDLLAQRAAAASHRARPTSPPSVRTSSDARRCGPSWPACMKALRSRLDSARPHPAARPPPRAPALPAAQPQCPNRWTCPRGRDLRAGAGSWSLVTGEDQRAGLERAVATRASARRGPSRGSPAALVLVSETAWLGALGFAALGPDAAERAMPSVRGWDAEHLRSRQLHREDRSVAAF